MSDSESHFFLPIPVEKSGNRVDKVLAELLPDYTRSAIQQWISNDLVLLEGSPIKQKLKVSGSETLEIRIPATATTTAYAEDIPLDIVFEDDHVLVINKPAGLVVHPGAGNQSGTLMNGLLYHHESQSMLPRAGIVHRLDKDTSGIMVVAKTEKSRQSLISQLQTRSMKRQYIAVTEGILIAGETIDQPIGRSRHDRLKMSVTASGKPAITDIRVLKKYRMHTLVEASLRTGRTHQIRVHLSWRGFSLVGDSTYGNRNRIPHNAHFKLVSVIPNFKRQALHARRLELVHPQTQHKLDWEVSPPSDFDHLIDALDADLDQTTNT